MININLFIPGRFEDAYLYMGQLITITEDRTVRFYNFEQIISDTEDKLKNAHPIMTYLFTRNDWLTSQQFKELFINKKIQTAFLSILKRVAERNLIELTESERYIQYEYALSDIQILLDFNVYNQRLYFAADTGLYHLDVNFGTGHIEPRGQMQKRHDARSLNAATGYGAIHVSCGNDGLFSGFDEFGWTTAVLKNKFRRTAMMSMRTAWSGDDLVNYKTATRPEMLSCNYSKTDSHGIEKEKNVLVAIEDEAINLDKFIIDAFDEEPYDEKKLRYVYNSKNNFFISTDDGELITAGIKRDADNKISTSFTRRYKFGKRENRILSINSTAVGLIIETDSQILLFFEGTLHPLLNSEVLSVRTFLRSRRYKNIVLMTKEDGILISSLFPSA